MYTVCKKSYQRMPDKLIVNLLSKSPCVYSMKKRRIMMHCMGSKLTENLLTGWSLQQLALLVFLQVKNFDFKQCVKCMCRYKCT